MNTVELHCIIHAERSEQLSISDILVAQLSEVGYQSFMETPFGLKAYIPEPDFDVERIQELPIHYMFPGKIKWQRRIIRDKNWNSEWEKSFKPVVIDNQCLIRAPFHHVVKDYPFEIVVEPKMSFGTGHHPTTSLMIRWMLQQDLHQKKVLDMGSGTGILAILASKKGASRVWAIDNDGWAHQNALENTQINGTQNIRVIQGTANSLQGEIFDVILANINLNILLQDIPEYAKSLNADGTLIISGIYYHDMSRVMEMAKQYQFYYIGYKEDNRWVAVAFKRSSPAE